MKTTEPVILLFQALLCIVPTAVQASSTGLVIGCYPDATLIESTRNTASYEALAHALGRLTASTTRCTDYIRPVIGEPSYGHGEAFPMKTTEPVILLFQVSKFVKCYRSDSRFIVVLCPKVLAANAMQCLSMLLLLAGDVELNPGPDTVHEMLEEHLKGQKTIAGDIQVIKTTQTAFSAQLDAMNSKISEIEIALKRVEINEAKIAQLKDDIDNMRTVYRVSAGQASRL
ncbi:hypothetical protein HPB48_009717 [Haemaphysalis longicornis]|uniref:Secreted protein n=1 Tax=Haemaphysalis longicornis TaxID=44386 RepID=A0A9J6G157_HAELO|nr:hypothetical protein HPB48_009717 [Haemaphysalis longicornis]